MDEAALQALKFGLAILGTLLIPLIAWVGSISYKAGGARTTLNGHTKRIEAIDERIDDLVEGMGEVKATVANIDGKVDLLVQRNGLKM